MKKLQLTILGLIISGLFFTGCERGIFSITGQGAIVEQQLTLSDFDAISVNDAIDVFITYGETQSVVVEGHQNIIDRLKLNVSGKTWEVDLIRGHYRDFELNVYITMPYLTEAKINGSGDIDIKGFENLDDLDLEINGSGDIYNNEEIVAKNVNIEISGSGNCEAIINAEKLDADITGSGNIAIDGTVIDQNLRICGSGRFESFDLLSESADIYITGSGDTEVNVENSMDVDITGSGNVYYKGYPSTNISITGSGSIINKN